MSRTAAERTAQAERLRGRPARGRILAAASQLAESKGYEELTVGELAKAAGVSRETFYTHFADKRACLAEATAPELGQIDALLRVAGERGGRWADPLAESLEHTLGDCFNSAQTPRGRILAAVVEVASERGFAGTRIIDVIRAAHVSHPAFYRHFESREQCFAAACESLVTRLDRRVEVEVGPQGSTYQRLLALAEILAAEPATAKVLAWEAPQLRPWAEDASGSFKPTSGAGEPTGPGGTPLAGLVAQLLAPRDEGAERQAADRQQGGELLGAGAILEICRSALREDALAELPERIGQVAGLFAGALDHRPEPSARRGGRGATRRREPARRREAAKRRTPSRA